MKRPLLYILLFIIFGIQIGYLFNSLFAVSILFIFLGLFNLFLSKVYKIKFVKFFIIFSFIGFFLTNSVKYHNDKNINAIIENNSKIQIVGTIKNAQITTENKSKFVLDAKYMSIDNNNINTNKNFLVYYNTNKNIKNGSYISLSGNLAFPNNQINPSGFNEELYYKTKGISYKMYADNVVVLKDSTFLSYLENLRQKIYNIYDEILPPKESNILKTMFLGDKQFLDDDISSLYKDVGIYHILAISGLHIGLLCFFLTKIFNKIHKKYGKIFVIAILIFYCLLTGASISTIRATLMCIIVLIGHIFYKDSDFISSICLSSIILLFINPYFLFDIGFLYSYVSVFSIGFLGERFVNLYNVNGIFKAFIISFFTCIAIKPITAYYFYNFQLLDIFINIIILPFMSIVVLIGFLSSIIGLFSIHLAEFFIGSVYYILRFFTLFAKIINNMEFNNIIIGKPDFIVIIGFYTMLIFIAYAVYDKYLLLKRKKYINIGMGIFICSIFLAIISPKPLSITMLDVGQGDSIVATSNDGNFLVDGGGVKNFSTGEQIVLPYLKSKGINNLDFIFISHIDDDHIKGILEILDDISVSNIFLPKTTPKENHYITLLNLAEEYNINIYYLENGDNLSLGKDLKFDILHPSDDFKPKDTNNNSLVFKLTYGENSILFTGDIESSAEKFLVNSNEDLSADILKVAHHGSKSSSSLAFLDKVNPDIALISCKKNNKYNHPHIDTIQNLEANKIKIFRTDYSNAITIDLYKHKNNIKIKTIN